MELLDCLNVIGKYAGESFIKSFIVHDLYNLDGSLLMEFGVEKYFAMSGLSFKEFSSWLLGNYFSDTKNISSLESAVKNLKSEESDDSDEKINKLKYRIKEEKLKDEYLSTILDWLVESASCDLECAHLLAKYRPDIFKVEVIVSVFSER